ncbi:DotH/IcmK family type IV secretion protein [Vogesella sp. XCS3]|uniref:DotH/IcmK family type IV secretion protein n=1 Tax=Vogesella sp. XCS3 TaxID=2877939 RepID=UPI001D0B544A|nr:DotH/IcmK family type IV secretion protein [Vogesella sp. XCS3]UDM18972.1 DotH/IcmK family type IV secretion protein [Vogesella sp. XCS3]
MHKQTLKFVALAILSVHAHAAEPQAAATQFVTDSANDPRLAVQHKGTPAQSSSGSTTPKNQTKDPLQQAMDADPVFGAVVKDAVPFDSNQIKMYRRQVEKVEKLKESPSVSGEQRTIPVRVGQTVEVNVAVGYPLTVRLTDVSGQPVKIAGNVPGLSIITVHPIPSDAQGQASTGSTQGSASGNSGANSAAEAKDAIVIEPAGAGSTTVTIFPVGSIRPAVVKVKSVFPKGGERVDFAADLRLTWVGGINVGKGDEYQTPLSGALLSVLKEIVGEEMQLVSHSGGDAIRVWRRLADGHVFVKMRPGVTLLSPRNFRTTTRDDDGGAAYEFDYKPASVVTGVNGTSRAIVIR